MFEGCRMPVWMRTVGNGRESEEWGTLARYHNKKWALTSYDEAELQL